MIVEINSNSVMVIVIEKFVNILLYYGFFYVKYIKKDSLTNMIKNFK